MDVHSFHRTRHFTAEARPAVSWILDPGLAPLIHHDHISGAKLGTEPTAHADITLDLSNHPVTSSTLLVKSHPPSLYKREVFPLFQKEG
jgi:hypothetical protein